MYYIVSILLLIILYAVLFMDDKFRQKRLQKILKSNKQGYEKIDKKHQHETFLKDRKVLDLCLKFKLISQQDVEQLSEELRLIGEKEPLQFICKFMSGAKSMILAAASCYGLGIPMKLLINVAGLDWDLLPDFIIFCGHICIFSCFFTVQLLRKEVKDKKKKMLKDIEEDYPRLFEHVYYYYGTPGNNYLLSEVLKSLSSGISRSTEVLLDGIISDCQYSEELALSNIKKHYHESTKLLNLADKLERCIGGSKLGPFYLKSLYDQMISSQDFEREEKERRRNEIYVTIMAISAGATVGLQMIGIGYYMFLKG